MKTVVKTYYKLIIAPSLAFNKQLHATYKTLNVFGTKRSQLNGNDILARLIFFVESACGDGDHSCYHFSSVYVRCACVCGRVCIRTKFVRAITSYNYA